MPKIRNSEAVQRVRHLQQQKAYEVFWRGKIMWALRKQKAPLIKAAKEQGLLSAYTGMDQLIKPDAITNVLERMYKGIVPKEAETYYREALQTKGMGFSFNWLASLQDWLNSFLYDMITNMTEYTKRTILKIIAQGLEDGISYDDIIKQIEATGLDKVRAAAIARTESNRAMGWAKYDSISKLPYPADVVWIAARDKRTRGAEGDDKADHYHMQGLKVQYMQPFTDPRSGSQLLFPGDVSLGAGATDTVNCRCTIAARRRDSTTYL